MSAETAHHTGATKDRILDTAEEIFADRGFAAASLREITRKAGVNLAAVNYHFGSKERLIQAVMARRLGPLNRERLVLLERILENVGTARPPVEAIVEAFIGPALRMKHALGEAGDSFLRLMGHAMNQPSDRLRELITGQFAQVVRPHGLHILHDSWDCLAGSAGIAGHRHFPLF